MDEAPPMYPKPKSQKARHTAPLHIPEQMTFYPTYEEFKDFKKYVMYLESVGAHHAGIVKIVPPKEWVPRKSGYDLDGLNFTIDGPLKQQFNAFGERGAYQTRTTKKQPITVKDYYAMAHSSTYKTPAHVSYEDLERKYWKSLLFVPPIYGADVSDSICDSDLDVWNIARLPSILSLVDEDYNQTFAGVNSPYMYFGMWKATFSWHVEDMDLYAINFIHHGAPKTWYAIPPKYGYLLEQLARTLFPNIASWCSNFMRHKTCLISPALLEEYGVPYNKVVQEERNIIIVFPYAYHSGFNHGFNIAESTNFALERWIEYGKRHRPCDCSSSRVMIKMDTFVKRFQPELYEAWMEGRDIQPHPEDPPEIVEEIKLRVNDPKAYAEIIKKRAGMKDTKEYVKFKTKEGKEFSVDVNTMKIRGLKDYEMTEEELEEFEEWKKFQSQIEKRTIDVYQHVDMPQVKVNVNPENLTCSIMSMNHLKDMMNEENDVSIEDLINKGILVKVATKVIRGKPSTGERFPSVRKPRETRVHIYKHVTQNLILQVVADTNELFKPTEDLTQFIGEQKITDLITSGDFQKVGERVYGGPPANATPIEPKKAVVHVYEHVDWGVRVTVSPKTFKVVGKTPDGYFDILGDHSLEELINEGKFKKVAEKVRVKRRTSTAQSARLINVYEHLASGTRIKIDAESGRTRGRPPANFKEILGGREVTDLPELVAAGEFRHVSQIKVEPQHAEQQQKQPEKKTTGRATYYHSATKYHFVVNRETMEPVQKTDKLVQILGGKSVEELITEGVVIPSDFFKCGSYDVFEEVVREVDIAQDKDKVLYRFNFNGDAASKGLFIENNSKGLIGCGKLIPSLQRQVEDERKLRNLLKVNFELAVYHRYIARGEKTELCLVDPRKKVIVGNQSESLLALQQLGSVDELVQKKLMEYQEEVEKYHGALRAKRIILGSDFNEQSKMEIQIHIDPFSVVTIYDTKNKICYIIKDETIPHPMGSPLDDFDLKDEIDIPMAEDGGIESVDESVIESAEEGSSKFDEEDLKDYLDDSYTTLETPKPKATPKQKKRPVVQEDDEESDFYPSSDEDDDKDDRDYDWVLHTPTKKRRIIGPLSKTSKKRRIGYSEPLLDKEFYMHASEHSLRRVKIPVKNTKIDYEQSEMTIKVPAAEPGQEPEEVVLVIPSQEFMTQGRECGCVAGSEKGTKRKIRCKRCKNCLTPKCGVCKHCTTPSMKKPCIETQCLLPRYPHCKCFD